MLSSAARDRSACTPSLAGNRFKARGQSLSGPVVRRWRGLEFGLWPQAERRSSRRSVSAQGHLPSNFESFAFLASSRDADARRALFPILRPVLPAVALDPLRDLR